ncbi:recombinase family protein [Allonocardiopsis opalescens]|uniref:DNA invertase Pin-like site-specific DNA recombinase n=1 Tax=Allonocardiopsis opalescens TaxID=1144618 RepID=A0A2T0PVP3_9ACTN|nr:recombinase family protein [Allonocardiopsis opalescens]PRX95616.1 DNA invertase Pin-like site-specific DNA recombinase [Allonocardiopsis opalescens]
MRAVIYRRQSSDRDATEYGVERQGEDCARLCADRGWTVVRTLTDNDVSASGRRPRPAYQELLQMIRRREVDAVVAQALDRLLRRNIELEELIPLAERAGVRIVTVFGDLDLSTDVGRMVGRILASVASGEIERKSYRQHRAQLQAARAGRRVGGRRPFGYEQDGMTVRPAEAEAVREGYRMLLAGASLGEIARAWTSAGHRAQRAQWQGSTVRAVLRNPRNAGLRAYHKEVVGAAAWPAIVPEETWRAACAVLDDPSRVSGRRGAPVALLTRVALCGVCDAHVHAGGAVRKYRMYRCSASLGHVGRKGEPIEEYVSALVVERCSRPDARELLVDRERPDVDALREESLTLRSRLDDLAVDYAEGAVSRAQLHAGTMRIRTRLVEIEAAMADAGRVDILGPLVHADDTRAEWEGYETSRRRLVIGALMTVRILPVKRGTRTFRPESLHVEWKG